MEDFLQNPLFHLFILPAGITAITQISKKFKIPPVFIAGMLSMVLAALYVLVAEFAGEHFFQQLLLYTSSMFGIATVLFKLIKPFLPNVKHKTNGNN